MEESIQIHTNKTEDKSKGLAQKILVSCLFLLIVGYINSLWKNFDYHPWYDALIKPIIAPSPAWLVGVIWTVMFITLGVAVGHIWQAKSSTSNEQIQQKAKVALSIFVIQLIVNMTVPSFFFWMNNLNWVLVGATINLLLMILLMYRFYQIKKTAGYLLIPFVIWLIYAVVLDISFVMIN